MLPFYLYCCQLKPSALSSWLSPDRIQVMDAMAVFIVYRLIVFVTVGNIVGHPDFRLSALLDHHSDRFRHQTVDCKTCENRRGGRYLLFQTRHLQNRVRIRHMVIDGDIGKIIDVHFRRMAPLEALGHFFRELMRVDGDEFNAALLRLKRHIYGRDVQPVEVDENERISLIDVVKAEYIRSKPLDFRRRRACGHNVRPYREKTVYAGETSCAPENLHRRD